MGSFDVFYAEYRFVIRCGSTQEKLEITRSITHGQRSSFVFSILKELNKKQS